MRQQGGHPHFGRCPEVEGAPPFWPWVQVLRSYRREVGPESWDEILEHRPQLGQLSRTLDERERWRGRVRPSQLGDDQFLLLDSICQFWARVGSHDQPAVLLIDDLHRADDASRELAQLVAETSVDFPVLFVATRRLTEEPEFRWASSRPHVAVELRGLSEEEAGDVATALGVGGVSAARVRMSAGNPLMLKFSLTLGEGAAVPSSSLEDLIAAFTVSLSEITKVALVVSSVIGHAFSVETLAQAMGVSDEKAMAAIRPAIRAGVLRPAGSKLYEYSHALLQDQIYSSIPMRIVEDLHSRVGSILDFANSPPAEVAYHFDRSNRSDDAARAALLHYEAGKSALGQMAVDEALEHFAAVRRFAAEGLLEAELLADLAIKTGEAEIRSGQRQKGVRRLAMVCADTSQDYPPDALLAAAIATVPIPVGIETGVLDASTISVLENALARSNDAEGEWAARIRSRLAIALSFHSSSLERRRELLSEAESLARSDSVKSEVSIARMVATWGTWDPGQVDGVSRLALHYAILSSDLELEAISRVLEYARAFYAGGVVGSRTAALDLSRLVANESVRSVGWYPDLYAATAAIEAGRLSEAGIMLDDLVLAVGDRRGANEFNAPAACMCVLRWHLGEVSGARQIAAAAAEKFPVLAIWRAADGMFAALAGDRRAAELALDQVRDSAINDLGDSPLSLPTLAIVAELCVLVQDRQLAAELLGRLARFGNQFVAIGFGVTSWGVVDRVRANLNALLGRVGDATHCFEIASAQCSAIGSEVWISQIEVERAEMLAASGESRGLEEARRLAGRAAEAASISGQAEVLRRATSVLGVVRETIGSE